MAVYSNNATRDVELKGNCYVFNNLSVLSKTILGTTLTVKAAGYKGSVRCVPVVDSSESSHVFVYNYRLIFDLMLQMTCGSWGVIHGLILIIQLELLC